MCRRVPTSPSPQVPTSPSPQVPTSPSPRVPASPRPRVPTSPRPHVPESPRPKSHVPVLLLVTAGEKAQKSTPPLLSTLSGDRLLLAGIFFPIRSDPIRSGFCKRPNETTVCFLAEIFQKVSFDPYKFRITRLSARKSEQMENF